LFAGIPWRNFTNNDLPESEGYYASVLYAFFVSLNAEIIPEDISNQGQVDLTVKLEGYIYVIEIKVQHGSSSDGTGHSDSETPTKSKRRPIREDRRGADQGTRQSRPGSDPRPRLQRQVSRSAQQGVCSSWDSSSTAGCATSRRPTGGLIITTIPESRT
jgi:hypothetical protein